MITKETLADRLHGAKIGEEDYDNQIITDAKENGLLIVFGESDDLCEFRGAFEDECSPDDKGRMPFLRSGKAFDPDAVAAALETLADELGLTVPMPETLDITAHWCKPAPDGRTPSWHYQTSLPHATFDVMEAGELYCIGMVIDLKEDGDKNQEGRVMDAKHTPGPWGIEETNGTNWIGPMRKSGDGKIAEIVCDTDRDRLTPEAIERSDANARLIAAAPELLAALKELRSWYLDQTGLPAVNANAAIAKAERRAM